MSNFVFGIPSYKRSEEQLTLEYLEKMGYSKDSIYISTQTKEDFEKYKEKYSNRANIIYKEGSCVSDNRNTILDYFDKGQNIVMLDDDISYIGKLKLQYKKHLHRLKKQLAECYIHTHPNDGIDHIEIYYR